MKNKLKKSGLIAITVIIGLLITACIIDPPVTTGTVTGTVLSTGSGTGIGGINIILERADGFRSVAVIEANSFIARGNDIEGARSIGAARSVERRATTNANGSFTITEVPAGTYTLYASSQNSLQGAVSAANVIVTANNTFIVEELELTPVGSISGKIEVESGSPWGFIVSVAGTSYMAITDSSGNFEISGIPAEKEYSFIITRGNFIGIYSEDPVEIEMGENEPLETREITKDELLADNFIYIGDNGNWFVNGVDTGIKAQGDTGQSGVVPGINLAAKLEWLQENAVSNTDYTIQVNADESIAPTVLFYEDRSNIGITLVSNGAERDLKLSSDGSMFTIGNGVTLFLGNNITLRGKENNIAPLVFIDYGGKLEMNYGSRITNNDNKEELDEDNHYGKGGGVYIEYNGTFIMNGGIISHNATSGRGGGVYSSHSEVLFIMNDGIIYGNTAVELGGGVSSNYFIMNGGIISDNKAERGAGVTVAWGDTFIMNGGKIFGNIATDGNGGGVDVNGPDDDAELNNGQSIDELKAIFTMKGGEIFNNKAIDGGGVMVRGKHGFFNMEGGSIFGNKADVHGGGVMLGENFNMTGGTIFGNEAGMGGGGVFVTSGIFNKTGGTITGYSTDIVNGNTVKNSFGVVQENQGHAVFVVDNPIKKEFTAGPEVNISFNGTTWNGGWEVLVPGNNLAEKLTWLNDANVYSHGFYTIDLGFNEYIAPVTFSYNGKENIGISLVSSVHVRTISLLSNGSMFKIGNGVTLYLNENITLEGKADNNAPLIFIDDGGKLEMNYGATITNNDNKENEFDDEHPYGKGGGVFLFHNSTFIMNGGIISYNSTAGRGGGVYSNHSETMFIMNDGIIKDNTADDMGGGVCANYFIMNGGTTSGNTAIGGAGVTVAWGDTFIMNGGTISGNIAFNDHGGGVDVHGPDDGEITTSFTMNGGTIFGNETEVDGGGVMVRGKNAFFYMYDGSIFGNKADVHGGGVFVGNGNFQMYGGIISGNTASNGGGVFVSDQENGTFVMNGGTISGNIALNGGGGDGGGVFALNTFNMINGNITGNYAGGRAGGVYAAHTLFNMEGGTISGNVATIDGGGVYIYEGEFTKTGGTITGYSGNPLNGNIVKDSNGIILNNEGHAIYVMSHDTEKYIDSTVGLTVNLSFNGTADPSEWEGNWDL